MNDKNLRLHDVHTCSVILFFIYKKSRVTMVEWLACLIFTAAIGVRIPVVAVKFHNVYDYTIERHPWQVSAISHGFTQAM